MPAEASMPPEKERKLYFLGIDLFNAGEFFRAHEAWEEIWHTATGAHRAFYHGMIQCAVALEHYRRSNPRGVLSLSKSYPPKFATVPEQFMGLDVKEFLADMDRALRPVVGAFPVPEKGQIALDLSAAPKIILRFDPFAGSD